MPVPSTEDVKKKIRAFGADRVGVADVDVLRTLPVDPSDLLDAYTRAVAIAVQLPFSVFARIDDRPTPLYAALYQTANRRLDDIALQSAVMLQSMGFEALPIPASQVLDKQRWMGAISHKAVAIAAGLGWQGKNLLVITPDFGSCVRLVTVLTDAPLTVDAPLENRCGPCMKCREACPAGAIRGVSTDRHYASREEALDFERCVSQVTAFAALAHVGAPICGICIRACPYSRRRPAPVGA